MKTWAILSLSFLLSCAVNPVTGEKEFMLVSESGELRAGDEALPSCVYSYDHEYKDPALKAYLGTIVRRLHSVSHRSNLPVDFRILDTSIPNAFAIPGHVFITRGLLAILRTEGQFAAVMGHELGHVAARHSAGSMTRNIVAGLGLSLLGKKLGRETMLGIGLGYKLFSLRYSRSQEYQADKLGAYYAWRAGYDPRSAIEVQEILKELSGKDPGFLEVLFSTHPPGKKRISRLKKEIRKLGLGKGWIQGDGRFEARWRRRLRGLRETDSFMRRYHDLPIRLWNKGKKRQAFDKVKEGLSKRGNLASLHLLFGKMAFALGRTDQACSSFRRALELDHKYLHAVYGLARAYEKTGNTREAEKYYRRCLFLFKEHYGAAYRLGMILYKQRDYKKAIPYLELALKGKKTREILEALATCHEKTNNHKAAEAYFKAASELGKARK